MVKKMELFINASGHPLHQETAKEIIEAGFKKIVDIPVPSIELNSNSIIELAKNIINTVSKKHKKVLKVGDFAILLPGLTPVAMCTLAIVHGACGHFPKIAFLLRNSEGRYAFGGLLDIQSLRDEARANFR